VAGGHRFSKFVSHGTEYPEIVTESATFGLAYSDAGVKVSPVIEKPVGFLAPTYETFALATYPLPPPRSSTTNQAPCRPH